MPKFKPMTAEELVRSKGFQTDFPVQWEFPEEGVGVLKGMDPAAQTNPLKLSRERKIAEMGFDEELLRQMPQGILDMTAQDLEDYASAIAGVEVHNPKVNALTIEDMQGIEALFREQRNQALVTLASRLGDKGNVQGGGVSVSCCCCSPCCCCAATEISPFD